MHYNGYFVSGITLLPYALQKRTEFHSLMIVKENGNICIQFYYFPFNFFFISKFLALQQSNFNRFYNQTQASFKIIEIQYFSRALCYTRTSSLSYILQTIASIAEQD